MTALPWIIIGITALILLFLIIFIFRRNKRPADYYAFFLIGIIWIIIGIPTKNYFFSLVGVAFAVIGLANRDKWKKNRRIWGSATKRQRIVKIFIIIILVLVMGILILFSFEKQAPKQDLSKITNISCDAVIKCPEGLECYSFPDIGTRCAELNPCDYFCKGKECLVLESYPEQIRCR
jgi:membrane-bound ClpP family serine protease